MSQNLAINVDNPTRDRVFAAFGGSSGGISDNNGAQGYWQSKNPQTPTPIIHVHGLNDGLIRYNGGNALGQVHTDTMIKFWVDYNNCNPTPVQYDFPDINTSESCTSSKFTYSGGDRGAQVVLYKLHVVINGLQMLIPRHKQEEQELET